MGLTFSGVYCIMAGMRIIGLMGIVGLLLAGILTPTIYATEDGQFPVFPTVIEGEAGATVSPSSQTVIEEKNVIQQTKKTKITEVAPVKSENIVTNATGVFSPWGLVKQIFVNRVKAGEEGVVFALEALDAKPSRQGDLRYQIFYANNTDETLRNISVQVFLPKELQYLDSDLRPDSKGNGVVIYEVGKIAAGEEGAIQLETRLKKKKAKEVVLGATMAYEDITGGKHTVTAVTNNAFNGSNGGLTASALDSVGGFIMWLFVIVLLGALAFTGYHYLTLKASGRRA